MVDFVNNSPKASGLTMTQKEYKDLLLSRQPSPDSFKPSLKKCATNKLFSGTRKSVKFAKNCLVITISKQDITDFH